MIKRTNIILLAVILVGLLGVAGYSTVTTGAGGSATFNQMRFDITQYTSDGLAGDAVLYYNSTTGRLELDDTWVAGAGLPAGSTAGEITFWDGAAWAVTTAGAGTNEIYWDDTNKSLGIGNDADDNTDIAFLSIADTTFTDTDDFYGIFVTYTKTAGDTTGADDYYGVAAAINHNFADTIGDLTALSGASTLTLGTATDVIGTLTGFDINGGTHTGAYGIYNTNDVAAAATTSGGLYGIYTVIDNDNDVGGSIWGEHINMDLVLGDISSDVFGIQIPLTITAGTTTGDYYGMSINIDQNGGVVTDNYGLYLTSDLDGTATDQYMIYIGENTGGSGNNYAIYQAATVGTTHLRGNYESPWVAMTIGNADNDNAVLAAGQFQLITVTASDAAANIGGMTTGTDGRIVTLFVPATDTITFEAAEIAEGGGFSPILNGAGDTAVIGAGLATFIYSSTASGWVAYNVP